MLFGDGSVAQVLLSAGQKSTPGSDLGENYHFIFWGLVVSFGMVNLLISPRCGIGVMLGFMLQEILLETGNRVMLLSLLNTTIAEIPKIYSLLPIWAAAGSDSTQVPKIHTLL